MGYTCKDCGWKPEERECVGATQTTTEEIFAHEKTHRKPYRCKY